MFSRIKQKTDNSDIAVTMYCFGCPDQIMQDGQPAPGSVRPIHRADVHVIEPAGSELWLDGNQDPHGGPGPRHCQ